MNGLNGCHEEFLSAGSYGHSEASNDSPNVASCRHEGASVHEATFNEAVTFASGVDRSDENYGFEVGWNDFNGLNVPSGNGCRLQATFHWVEHPSCLLPSQTV